MQLAEVLGMRDGMMSHGIISGEQHDVVLSTTNAVLLCTAIYEAQCVALCWCVQLHAVLAAQGRQLLSPSRGIVVTHWLLGFHPVAHQLCQ